VTLQLSSIQVVVTFRVREKKFPMDEKKKRKEGKGAFQGARRGRGKKGGGFKTLEMASNEENSVGGVLGDHGRIRKHETLKGDVKGVKEEGGKRESPFV